MARYFAICSIYLLRYMFYLLAMFEDQPNCKFNGHWPTYDLTISCCRRISAFYSIHRGLAGSLASLICPQFLKRVAEKEIATKKLCLPWGMDAK